MSDVLRLLQLSDPHLFASTAGELKGVRTYESLRRVLAHARQYHWNAAALLLTGDLVHDEPAGYEHIRQIFGGLDKPVYCVPGNHDDPAALSVALQQAPFQVGGHVDFDHWRVVMLDSAVPGKAHGALSAAELSRLDAALDSAGGRHVLIAVHHHPVQLASRWLDAVRLQNGSEFFAITDRHPSVRAIVWGHVHQSFDARRKGVRLMAVPSTSAQFLPYSEDFTIDPSPPGYRRLALYADGSIDTEVVRVEFASDTTLLAAG